MINTYSLNKNSIYYYDLDEKCIARYPSKSNLLPTGSDNSLYFGNRDNETVKKVFCDIFDVDSLEKVNGKRFKMVCIDEKVEVVFNLNAEGQVQIKIMKNGSMFKLASNYSLKEMQQYDFTKMLIVIDFNSRTIRFKDPNELKL